MGTLSRTVSLQVYNSIRRIVQTPLLSVASTRAKITLPTDEGGIDRDLTVGEEKLIAKLKAEFPTATYIQVSDISGGCGAMYQISLESPEFKDMRTVQQHRLVNKALAKEIKEMHGLQLNTKATDDQ